MTYLWSINTIFNIIGFENFHLVKTTFLGHYKRGGIIVEIICHFNGSFSTLCVLLSTQLQYLNLTL